MLGPRLGPRSRRRPNPECDRSSCQKACQQGTSPQMTHSVKRYTNRGKLCCCCFLFFGGGGEVRDQTASHLKIQEIQGFGARGNGKQTRPFFTWGFVFCIAAALFLIKSLVMQVLHACCIFNISCSCSRGKCTRIPGNSGLYTPQSRTVRNNQNNVSLLGLSSRHLGSRPH